jgi:putative flippase GtrA
VIGQFFSRRFLLFLASGGTAALVNFGSRIFYNRTMSFSSAVIVAYFTGMVVAFVLARSFVFGKGGQSVGRSALFFFLVNVAGVAQAWVVSVGLDSYVLPGLGWTWHLDEVAHAFGLAVPAFTSFIGHKRFSFK